MPESPDAVLSLNCFTRINTVVPMIAADAPAAMRILVRLLIFRNTVSVVGVSRVESDCTEGGSVAPVSAATADTTVAGG